MNVKIRKVRADGKIPAYGSAGAAGADLYACLERPVMLMPGETRPIHTGIALEIPEGYVGLVYARSGMALKKGLAPANKVGVIDSDYRGEIIVALHNHGAMTQAIEPGERVAQIVFTPCMQAAFEEADELSDTQRGSGGFGSTGQ